MTRLKLTTSDNQYQFDFPLPYITLKDNQKPSQGQPIEQFDERDNVFARRDLKPGTVQYEEYYKRHPGLEQSDAVWRASGKLGQGVPRADDAMFDAPAWVMAQLGNYKFLDGEPSPDPVVMTPERAAEKIKAYARHLGADLVGISPLKQEFVYSHRGRLSYQDDLLYGAPIELNHAWSISLGFHENVDLIRTGPYHGEMMETGRMYYLSTMVSVALARYIRMLGYPARAHHFCNYQVLPVPLAVEAGLGELGRCGFLMTKEYGNCLRLSTVTTDIPLVPDEPVDIGVEYFCKICKVCAEACPSDSIPYGGKVQVRGFEKWQIDAETCIAYWHKAGTDCGMCIASCPWSQPYVWWHRLSAWAAGKSKFAGILLLWIHRVVYGKYRPRKMPDWLDPREKRR